MKAASSLRAGPRGSALPKLKAPVVLPARAGRVQHLQQRGKAAAAVAPPLEGLVAAALSAHPGLAAGAAANTAIVGGGIGLLLKGLTWPGIINAWLLGTGIFSAFGLSGYLLVVLYFIFGTAVTKVKLEQKQKEGIAEARSGLRGPASVWGSGSAGMFCAVMALLTGDFLLWQVGFVASFTSKLSDTVSSEIGKAYGKTTYLITTLQRVPRGTEGAVSAEGTAAGAAAALLFSLVALAIGQVDLQGAIVAAAAATAANVFESWLGATLQGRIEWITNDVVNVIQISVATALAILGTVALA